MSNNELYSRHEKQIKSNTTLKKKKLEEALFS